jgi:hypothetical protein
VAVTPWKIIGQLITICTSTQSLYQVSSNPPKGFGGVAKTTYFFFKEKV